MNSKSTLNVVVGVVTLAAIAGGAYWMVTAVRRKRARKIADYIGFDPDYYLKGGHTIGHTEAKKVADGIYKSVGIFNDNEESFYRALKSAKSAGNLSLISHYFEIRHGRQMGEYISNYFDRPAEVKEILNILREFKS